MATGDQWHSSPSHREASQGPRVALMVKQHRRNEGQEQGLLTPHRETSPISIAREILALGDMAMVEKRVTQSPAEDGDPLTVLASRLQWRLAIRYMQMPHDLPEHPHQPGPPHRAGQPTLASNLGSTRAWQCARASHRETGGMGSSLSPASDPS